MKSLIKPVIQDVAVVSDGSFCWRKWSICRDQQDDAALVHVAQAEKTFRRQLSALIS
jgi:hypothetical protein